MKDRMSKAAIMRTYEVVYIDKFKDSIEADLARVSLKERFNLSDRKLDLMSSGLPVVVKKGISFDEACIFEDAIKRSGGVCWIQEMSPDGLHYERRTDPRRLQLDRRETYRGSSIQPDRRMGVGRRTDDQRRWQ